MRVNKELLGHVSGHVDVDACVHVTRLRKGRIYRERGETKDTKYHMRPAHL